MPRKRSYIPVKVKIGGLILVLVSSALFSLSKAGNTLTDLSLDALFLLRGSQPSPAEVVIVAVDEPSFSSLGLQWPWPRSLHGDLIRALTKAGARTIAMDIIFAEATSREEDEALAQAIKGHGNVILGSDIQTYRDQAFVQQLTVKPLPAFLDQKTPISGFVNLPMDHDGFVRRVKPSWNGLPPFSLAAALRHHPGPLPLPATDSDWIINFQGQPQTVKTVSYYQALSPDYFLPPGFFRDKLVFVGLMVQSAVNAESMRPDYFPTPFSRVEGGYMAGVEVHSQAANAFLHHTMIRRLLPVSAIVLGLFAALLFSPLFFRLSALPVGALATGWLVFLGLGSSYLLHQHSLFFSVPDLFLPVAGGSVIGYLCNYYEQLREKKFIAGAFSSYLAPSIVKQLVENPERLRLGGEEMEATVMFVDIAGFTSISEKMSAPELITFLNRIMGTISRTVFETEGMVDKYIGDAVMAVWGVPLSYQGHGRNACRAALSIRRAFTELNRQNQAQGLGPVGYRIGINSGPMVAGNVGGEHHISYTVIGDHVNLGSRIEGVNKQYGTTICITADTACQLDETFVLRELDTIQVKGKDEPVTIFELQGTTAEVEEEQLAVNRLYGRGLTHYRKREWHRAKTLFSQAVEVIATDGPSQEMVRRCQLLLETAPPPEWDGVFRMTSK